MKSKILIIVLALMLVLLPTLVSASTLPVLTEAQELWTTTPGAQGLVRWPDGTMFTAYSKLVSSASELFVVYSEDEGINWNNILLQTSYGYDQLNPTITMDSEYDIHVAWIAFAGAGSWAGQDIRYIEYDTSEAQWGDVETVWHSEQDDVVNDNHIISVAIATDSNDVPHIAFRIKGWGTSYKNRVGGSWSEPSTSISYESYVTNVTCSNWCAYSSMYYYAQTFTVGSEDIDVVAIDYYGMKGSTYNGQIRISAVDGGGAPTGSALSTGTINYNTLPVDMGWIRIYIAPITLTASTQYAILNANTRSAPNSAGQPWGVDSSGSYSGGKLWRCGDPWTEVSGYDADFRVITDEGLDVISTHGDAGTVYDKYLYSGVSIAIDQGNDDDVGISYGESTMNFQIRESGVWQGEEVIEDGSNESYYTSGLMVSKEGANTIWRVGYVSHYSSTNKYWRATHSNRIAGSWTSPYTVGSYGPVNYGFMTCSIAQNHIEGEYSLVFSYTVDYRGTTAASSYIMWYEYYSGSWHGHTVASKSNSLEKYCGVVSASSYYPRQSGHSLELPADDAILLAFNLDDDGDDDEGIIYGYYGDWGEFPPMVETISVTGITQESATVNGSILATNPNCTIIGAQYGLTQTPTWSEYTTGNYAEGDYSINITDLESDTIYYTRIYATNSAGTSYGDWIGFLASQPSYDEDEITDDSGLTPPNPDEPGGWIRPPKDWGDFNGIPWTFIAFLFIAGGMTATGLLITSTTRNVIVLFGVLGFIMAIFCILPRGGYLDWWVMFPYFIVGWALIKRDQQAPMG